MEKVDHKFTKVFIRGLFRILIHIAFNIEYAGEKYFPEDGGYLVCSNHLSVVDIPIIQCRTKNRWMYFMSKKELFENKLLAKLMNGLSAFPVDRGRGAKSIRVASNYLNDDKIVCIFPQGTRERNGKRLKARKGPAILAAMSEKPIVPVLIEGEFKFRKKIKVTIGKKYDLNLKKGVKYSREEYEVKSQEVMDLIYNLKETN